MWIIMWMNSGGFFLKEALPYTLPVYTISLTKEAVQGLFDLEPLLFYSSTNSSSSVHSSKRTSISSLAMVSSSFKV